MTTPTDNGLDWVSDKQIDLVAGRIDTVAVGTGTNEDPGSTALGNRVYYNDYTGGNVTFVDTGDGVYEARIEVTGGQEVSANTRITETGVFAGDPTASGVLIVIDEFPYVEVESGETERFSVPIKTVRK